MRHRQQAQRLPARLPPRLQTHPRRLRKTQHKRLIRRPPIHRSKQQRQRRTNKPAPQQAAAPQPTPAAPASTDTTATSAAAAPSPDVTQLTQSVQALTREVASLQKAMAEMKTNQEQMSREIAKINERTTARRAAVPPRPATPPPTAQVQRPAPLPPVQSSATPSPCLAVSAAGAALSGDIARDVGPSAAGLLATAHISATELRAAALFRPVRVCRFIAGPAPASSGAIALFGTGQGSEAEFPQDWGDRSRHKRFQRIPVCPRPAHVAPSTKASVELLPLCTPPFLAGALRGMIAGPADATTLVAVWTPTTTVIGADSLVHDHWTTRSARRSARSKKKKGAPALL